MIHGFVPYLSDAPPGAPGSLKILPPGGRRHFCKQHRDLYVDTGEIRCTVYIASEICCRTDDGGCRRNAVRMYISVSVRNEPSEHDREFDGGLKVIVKLAE